MARHTPELLTLQEAAERLSVHYMTAYRWVRKGDLPAFKTGGRLRVRLEDLERFLADRAVNIAMTRDTSAGQTDWLRHVDRLIASLLAGDGSRARNDVHKVIADGATAGDVYVRLITPALHEVGEAWARGDIGVAEEHRASQICVTIVAQLSDMFRRRRPSRGTAVTLTPPEERHALASAMVGDFLRAAGYDVHHLGAGVPATDLAVFLQVVPADLVCFSVTQPIAAEDYRELVNACLEACPNAAVLFGGQGVDVDAAQSAGAMVVADIRDLTGRVADL